MKVWKIYDKNGTEKCETKKLVYSGEFMGACSVSVTISSPTAIDFQLGDWLEYRGERFELNYDPSVVKSASSGMDGEGFVYDDVVFNSLSDELTRCAFLDHVTDDNGLHYYSLPTFSFFADSVKDLAERIQANLDRVYKDEKAWTVEVNEDADKEANINVSIQNNNVWEALGLVNSLFGMNFSIRGRRIIIGASKLVVKDLFSYGKGNGLYKIEKNAESDQQIITRLRAYGSTRNLPDDYYVNLEEGLPNNMAVTNLMLPSFPYETYDPYIDSPNIETLGVREGVVFFDGSSELQEIYPSMEGMTAELLRNAGVYVNATGELDIVLSADVVDDDGKAPAEGEGEPLQATFKVRIKDIGFDINDHLSADNAILAMQDGMCGGREFEIVKCEKTSEGYELTCNRSEDAGLGLFFPYKDYPIRGKDKFVLLNIEMPEVYVKVASQKLLEAAKAYLAKNDSVRYSYSLTVDNLFMARQHDEAASKGEASIHDTIKEGDLMLFEDEDLGIDGSVTIASLSIKEDLENSLIPEYDITLQDKKSVGTIQKIQNQLANLAAHGTGGAVDEEQVKGIIEAVGKRLFLSKVRDDRSRGIVASDKGFEVGKFQEGVLGTGAAMYQNAEKATFVETDFLTVRKKAFFTNITVQELKHVGGVVILSPAAMVCSKVEETTTGWKCYFNTKDADGRRVYNDFEVGDQARCQTFNLEQQADGMVGNRYYWRLVKEWGEDFIVLSKTDYDKSVPNDIPQEGDNICQLGNRNDSLRQNAIVISAYGTDAPSFKQYKGIKSYNMADAELVTKLSPFGNEIKGKFISEDGTDIKDELEGVRVDWDKVLEQTDKEFTIWYYDYAPTLSNKPAVDWTTDELKELHEEDLFYNTNTGVAYRFEKVFVSAPDGNGGGIIETQYMWVVASDEQTIKALQAAAKAQDTADGKRRVFLTQPTPPYDAGDQWVNATYGELFDDDDLVCATPKAEGEEFSIEDWRPVSYGRTSVIKNMEGEIQLIANAFELGADGNLYLKNEAGMKITAEMAKIYATQTSLDLLGNRVNDLSSEIDVTANKINLFTQKFSFDSDGNVTNINTSGLVTTSDFSSMFAQSVVDNNLVARAELSVFVKTDLNGNVSSGVYINADNVRINGITDIGSNKVSIGGFTINSDYMQAGVSTASGIMTLSATTLGFKEDGGMHVLIGPGAFGAAGEVGLYSNAPSGGFSVWGIGGAKMVARETNSEMVLIGGLALTYKFGNSFTYPANSPSGATGAWADFLVMNGNASLPNPSSCPGKVLFVKCKSGSTLSVPNGMDAEGGSKTSWNDGNSRFFISSSSNWHEFYCS